MINPHETHQVIVISTGGGMIDIIEIEQAPVSMLGDFFVTLLYVESKEDLVDTISKLNLGETILNKGSSNFISVNSNEIQQQELLSKISLLEGIQSVNSISQVHPIKSRQDLKMPFIRVEDMLEFNEYKNLN